MSQINDCDVGGNNLKSKKVTYTPKEIKSGTLFNKLDSQFIKETLGEIVRQLEVLHL